MESISTEMVASGTTLDWYADNQIVSYTIAIADEGIMDALTNKVNSVLESWDTNKPYLALHDLSAPGVAVFYMIMAHYQILNLGIKPENREYAESIISTHQHPARVAYVLSLSLSGKVTHRSVELTADDTNSLVQYKTFFKKDLALQWLAEAIV